MKTFALTVTYGERWIYIERLLASLKVQSAELAGVCIVANGVPYDLRQKLKCSGFEWVTVISLPGNLGTAKGFGTGFESCIAAGADSVWMLDDDNEPEPGALMALCRETATKSLADNIVVSLRPARGEYMYAAVHGLQRSFGANAFLNFSGSKMTDAFKRYFFRRDLSLTVPVKAGGAVKIAVAPYGGMLVGRDVFERVGGLNDEMVLYSDDHEFCYRAGRLGVSIWLCCGSIVNELEESFDRVKSVSHYFFDYSVPDYKIYYSVRNRVFVEVRYKVESRWRYAINACIYMASVLFLSLPSLLRPRKFGDRFSLVAGAIFDGVSGRLGSTVRLK